MRDEELRIISLLRKGDNGAYKYIYDHHYNLLCNIAFQFLKDDFLAETIVDDMIFHLWEKRETIDITISLKSYLIRAVRNRCLNHLNLEREKREINFSVMENPEETIHSFIQSEEYPLATLLENELEKEIQSAIERLPLESKKVFQMSRFENKRYEEIAKELNISVNTVKYHIKNALARLNADLSKYLLFFF